MCRGECASVAVWPCTCSCLTAEFLLWGCPGQAREKGVGRGSLADRANPQRGSPSPLHSTCSPAPSVPCSSSPILGTLVQSLSDSAPKQRASLGRDAPSSQALLQRVGMFGK